VPPADPPDLHLTRAARRAFPGPAALLGDPAHRERSRRYLADLARQAGQELPAGLFDPASGSPGQSYAEMAETLVRELVPPDEPVDLLVLAFSGHDMLPGRATATYLSHVCPGNPLSFAVCDQGSAAPFSGLRIAHAYAASGDCRRAVLIAVEQAVLPYRTPTPGPARHQGVAMLYATTTARPAAPDGNARMTVLRQHPDVAAGDVAALAAAELATLSAGCPDARVVLGAALAAAWPAHPTGRVTVTPPGQPVTGLWWTLLDRTAVGAPRTGPVLAADYDPELRYLCLVGWDDAGTPDDGRPDPGR
jgi:4-hydroxymandelate oxidase